MTTPRSLLRLFAAVAFSAAAAGSALASSFSTSVTSVSASSTIDLSALGSLDWVKYNTWTSNNVAPFAHGTLTGTSMALGSGIGSLQNSDATGYPGTMAGTKPTYTWDDGDSPAAGSGNTVVARYNWQLNGSAVAATTERTLYVFIGLLDGNASVSINLPGASSANIPITWGGGGVPSYSMLAITFTGDAPGDNLTFSLVSTGRTGIGAIALDAAAVPEPSSYAALAGLGMLGFATLRRRRAVRV